VSDRLAVDRQGDALAGRDGVDHLGRAVARSRTRSRCATA
jgi:hypothetical protein